ncbi:MAG: acyl-CoA dehydrogenase family protein [Myxococcota bacterium]
MNDASPDPMQAAHALAPELRARAEEIEAARRLPRDLSDRFAAAGFYRLLVPEAYGGLERPPREAMEIFEVLARADGASAWCAFIGATSGRVLASLPEATARAVFREPTTLVCGAVAPRGRALAAEGGVRVTGRWAWGSGIANADWVLAGCAPGEATDDAGTPPRPRLVLVPAAQVEILDTWHVSGLAGTGSTDFALEDVRARVADRRPRRKARGRAAALRVPAAALLGLSLGAIALGLARAAIDELIALAGGKTPQGSSRPLAARAHTQSEVALAEAGVRSARAFYLETIDAAWTEARARGVIPVECRRDLRLATTHAARASAEAIDRMYHVSRRQLRSICARRSNDTFATSTC